MFFIVFFFFPFVVFLSNMGGCFGCSVFFFWGGVCSRLGPGWGVGVAGRQAGRQAGREAGCSGCPTIGLHQSIPLWNECTHWRPRPLCYSYPKVWGIREFRYRVDFPREFPTHGRIVFSALRTQCHTTVALERERKIERYIYRESARERGPSARIVRPGRLQCLRSEMVSAADSAPLCLSPHR